MFRNCASTALRAATVGLFCPSGHAGAQHRLIGPVTRAASATGWVAGATVSVLALGAHTGTVAGAFFQLDFIRPGTYVVVVQAPAFQPKSAAARIDELRSVNVDFELVPAPPPSYPTPIPDRTRRAGD